MILFIRAELPQAKLIHFNNSSALILINLLCPPQTFAPPPSILDQSSNHMCVQISLIHTQTHSPGIKLLKVEPPLS